MSDLFDLIEVYLLKEYKLNKDNLIKKTIFPKPTVAFTFDLEIQIKQQDTLFIKDLEYNEGKLFKNERVCLI
jgi:hypothetical protein